MLIFSFISKLFSKTNSITTSFLDEQEVVDKTLFYTLLDLNDSTILFFNKQSGYIGANGAFFQLFGFKNIDDFKFEDFELVGYDPHPPIKGDITVVGGF